MSFEGTYKGPLTEAAGVCSDGSTWASSTSTVTMDLTQPSAKEVDINLTDCPGLRGTANGNAVTIQQTTCPPQSTSSGTVTTTFTGGTLTLNGSSLSVTLAESFQVNLSNGASGTCTTSESGTLVQQ